MRVAWVTHREWTDTGGGAEAADFDMAHLRPSSVKEITLVAPGGVSEDLLEYDRVIVTGLYGFSPRELNTLGRCKPVMWVHDTQFSGHWLLEHAKTIVLLTPGHMDYETTKNPLLRRDRIVLNPGWMDTTQIHPAQQRGEFALWAHRPVAHKGLDKATDWSNDKGVPLRIMVNEPHAEVLRAMSVARYFVLLSHIFDPGPRSVIEAQLSGCELVVDNVGYWDEDPVELRARLNSADSHFWGVVLS